LGREAKKGIVGEAIRMNTRWIGGIYLLWLSLSSGFAQNNGFAAQLGAPASVLPGSAHRQITLDVVVTDKSGTPVAGLQQQDFTLLDNKQPQKIASFYAAGSGTATADPPLEAILVVDAANTSFTSVEFARKEIVKFLGRNGGQLASPVSVIVLSGTGGTLQDNPSRDGNALIAYLDEQEASLRTSRRSQGFYGARDRMEFSVNALLRFAGYEAERPGRKLVIWVSPGWPLFNGPGVQISEKAQQWFFNNIVAFSNGLRRARITLYGVDPLGLQDAVGLRTSAYKGFLKGVKTAKQAQPGDVALQVLANQSGGLVLNASNDIAGEIAKCIADASAYYVLTFDALPGDGPNEYHALEVKLDKGGLAARTRSGYYAQPR
jgi:VWFA-related protein